MDEIAFHSYAGYVGVKILASSLNLNKLIDISTDMVVELMRVEQGCLMLFNEKSGELSVESCKGLKQKQIKKKTSIKTKKDVVKWIVEWKEPILLSELAEPRVKEFFRAISEEIEHGICLSIPLVAKDKLIGLFNLGEEESGKPFCKKDLQMLSTISGTLAIAVENAKLYQDLLKSYFSTVSARIIDRAEFPWDVKSLARHHHKRYDGKGYPGGLKGKDIPLGARILAVADTYEALMADRPYRRGFAKEKTLEIIKEPIGNQPDPKIVQVFRDLAVKEEI